MNTNKSAQILQYIAKKNIISLRDLTQVKSLLELFATTKSTTATRRITDTCALLARQGYTSVGMVDNEKVYKITHKGSAHLKQVEVLEVSIDKRRWNGRWYLIAFDIEEGKKTSRNQLILVLKRYGFLPYSKGLWVYPYNPAELIAKIKTNYDLEKQIKLIIADYIDNENTIKKLFRI